MLLIVLNARLNQLGIRLFPGERRIAKRPIQRMRHQPTVLPSTHVVGVAGPWMVQGLRHHASANRVQIDINHASEEIPVGLNQSAAKPAFPQGAGAGVFFIEITHIVAAQVLHHF